MKTLFVATKTGHGIEADHGKALHFCCAPV